MSLHPFLYPLIFDRKRRNRVLQKGGVGSYVFYGFTILVLLSIPVTMILVNTNTNQVSRASQETVMFTSPPSVSVTTSTEYISAGIPVSIHIEAPNSNWYVVYFSDHLPTVESNMSEIIAGTVQPEGVQVVYRGSSGKDFQYVPRVSGYVFASAYQLQGIFGDFNPGDTVCIWNGSLYMFRTSGQNPIISLLSRKKSGRWDDLTTCQNSGPSKIQIQ